MVPDVWLITGGAGYIGSHISDLFLAREIPIVIYDSLLTGTASRVDYLNMKHNLRIPFIRADIRDLDCLRSTIIANKVTGIIHTAALKSVSESLKMPDLYSEINYKGTAGLIGVMQELKIRKLIFSSTAAVYGDPNSLLPCKESDLPSPISPYGKSKLSAEELVTNFNTDVENLGVSLRFFNVIGRASSSLTDNSIENLVPIVLSKLINNESPEIYGTDYPTKDGTCVRDYVDVRDIARAHLEISMKSTWVPPVLNIGTGIGISVDSIVNLIIARSNRVGIKTIKRGRRQGDPAFLCAEIGLASRELGFTTVYDLASSIDSLHLGQNLF